MKRAVFLDRDGTINVEKGNLFRPEDWEWIPGAISAIRDLNAQGFEVVVITNQAGVARGYYTEMDIERLHAWVDLDLVKHSARIDAYYYCPHHPDFTAPFACLCRKPAPGMLLKAARERGIDLRRSYLVGDKMSDIMAARAAGVRPVMVATGYGEGEKLLLPEGVPLIPSLADLPTLLSRGQPTI